MHVIYFIDIYLSIVSGEQHLRNMSRVLHVFRAGPKILVQIDLVTTGPGWSGPIKSISETEGGVEYSVWMNTSYWHGGLTLPEGKYPNSIQDQSGEWDKLGTFRLDDEARQYFKNLGLNTYFIMDGDKNNDEVWVKICFTT